MIDYQERLFAILRPRLRFMPPDHALKPEDSLGALGLDSMASIDVLMDIEAELGVIIPDEAITVDTFATAGGLLEALQKAAGQA
jgi:acyl carrier protein